MNKKLLVTSCSKIVLWGLFLVIFVFFAAMASVTMGWGDNEISFPDVVRTIDWTRLADLHKHEYFTVFAVAASLISVYSAVPFRKVRLALMIAGFISPLLLIDPEMAIFILFGPFIVLVVLTGQADGENFVEQIPESGSVGMLMILYLAFSVHHLYFLIKAPRKLDAQQAESCCSNSAVAPSTSVLLVKT